MNRCKMELDRDSGSPAKDVDEKAVFLPLSHRILMSP